MKEKAQKKIEIREVTPSPLGYEVGVDDRKPMWTCGNLYECYRSLGFPKMATVLKDGCKPMTVYMNSCPGEKPVMKIGEDGNGICHPNGEGFGQEATRSWTVSNWLAQLLQRH